MQQLPIPRQPQALMGDCVRIEIALISQEVEDCLRLRERTFGPLAVPWLYLPKSLHAQKEPGASVRCISC